MFAKSREWGLARMRSHECLVDSWYSKDFMICPSVALALP